MYKSQVDYAAGERRTSTQRSEMVTFVSTLTRSTNLKRKSRYLLLPRDQFIAWHCFHLRLSEEKASRLWKDKLNDPKAHIEEEDGETCIAVKQPTEISSADKIERSKAIQDAPQRINRDDADRQMQDPNAVPLSHAPRGVGILAAASSHLKHTRDFDSGNSGREHCIRSH